MTLDLDRIRRDTPGTQHVHHFNNAGSSLPPQPVLDAQFEYMKLESEIGGYEAAAARSDATAAVYGSIAQLVGAERDEIALVENATVAWDMAFYALPFGPGDRILTAQAEYAANFVAYLQVAKRTGAVIDVIPSTDEGEICLSSLEAMIDPRVKLISITHVPTNGGLVNPAAEVGRIARANGITYLLDACQSVGQMPIDVKEIGCDILSATGRKYLRGPRGTGFLYVRRDLAQTLEPPIIDHFSAEWEEPGKYVLRPDARRFENWENNYALRLGLGAAAEYAIATGPEETWARIISLAGRLREGLGAIGGVELRDIGTRKCGIVSFTVKDRPARDIKSLLAERRINVSVSDPSSTLIDSMARDLPDIVRASVHYYNTEEEVDFLLDTLGSELAA